MLEKIGFDAERLKYTHTGLHTFCESLGMALVNNAASDQQITAYVPPQAINIFGKNTPYIIQRPWHKFFLPGTSGFKVWHSTYQSSRYYPSNSSVNIVLTIHDLNFLIEKKERPAKIRKLLKRIQNHIDRASVIVCISHFVADQVKQYLNIGLKPLEVIYNGCTINDFPEFNSPGYTPQNPFLFSIGTILPKKNFHVLPALLKGNDYELIIAGNFSSIQYVEEVLAEAKKHDVTSRVKIIGSISDEERSWYYRNCKAFVFPSIAEGFGLPVIEAMHYGKPVFLSTLTSLPEIGSDAAYYFKNFEVSHMQEILKEGLEDFLTGDMEHRARKRATVFNWDETAKKYLGIYRSL